MTLRLKPGVVFGSSYCMLIDEDIPRRSFDGMDIVYVTNLNNEAVGRFSTIFKRAKPAGAFVSANPDIRQLV